MRDERGGQGRRLSSSVLTTSDILGLAARSTMRAPLVMLALLAPFAAAQAAGTAVVTIEPLDEPLAPSGPSRAMEVVVEGQCSPEMALPPGLVIELRVARQPSWLVAALDPSTHHVPEAECVQGAFRRESALRVAATDAAPAFTPEAVEVEAELRWAMGGSKMVRMQAPVVAGYTSTLDVLATAPALPGPHGELVILPLSVTNLGNGPTKVVFDVVRADAGVRVAAPSPIVLGSKPTGAREITTLVPVQAARMLAAGEEELAFTIGWRAQYALDSQLEGDAGSVTLRLLPPGAQAETPRSLPEDVQQRVPGGGALGATLALVAAALKRASRRAR